MLPGDGDSGVADISGRSLRSHCVSSSNLSGASFPSKDFSYQDVGIFWDLENIPVPEGKSPQALVWRIKENFQNRRIVAFYCVCDVHKELEAVTSELSKVLTLVHVKSTAKNAADSKIIELMTQFSYIHPNGSKVVLVSNDVNFAPTLRILRESKFYQPTLIHTSRVSQELLDTANELFHFDEFSATLPERQKSKDRSLPPLVVVTGFSKQRNLGDVKKHILLLASPLGGKLYTLFGKKQFGPEFGILKFANVDIQLRARKKLDREAVYKHEEGNPQYIIRAFLPDDDEMPATIRTKLRDLGEKLKTKNTNKDPPSNVKRNDKQNEIPGDKFFVPYVISKRLTR